jgi:transcriptional regulator of acetoin/glycerol metabolism
MFHDAPVGAGADPVHVVPDVTVARALLLAPWAENVRGLRSLAERAGLGETLTPKLIADHAGRGIAFNEGATMEQPVSMPWPPSPQVLLETLAANGWKVTAAAGALGVRRETLARQLTRSFGPSGGKAAKRAWTVCQETGKLP